MSTKRSHWMQWTVPPSVERRDLVLSQAIWSTSHLIWTNPRTCLTQSGPHGAVQGPATAAGQAGTRSGVPKSIGLRVENQRLRTRVGELVALDSYRWFVGLGYGLLLAAIAGRPDRAGRGRRRSLGAWRREVQRLQGVEVVVKCPDDVLGRELESLPPSRICVWSTRLFRLRAEVEAPCRPAYVPFGPFESAAAVGTGTSTANGGRAASDGDHQDRSKGGWLCHAG
jgi:hypothetical protein